MTSCNPDESGERCRGSSQSSARRFTGPRTASPIREAGTQASKSAAYASRRARITRSHAGCRHWMSCARSLAAAGADDCGPRGRLELGTISTIRVGRLVSIQLYPGARSGGAGHASGSGEYGAARADAPAAGARRRQDPPCSTRTTR